MSPPPTRNEPEKQLSVARLDVAGVSRHLHLAGAHLLSATVEHLRQPLPREFVRMLARMDLGLFLLRALDRLGERRAGRMAERRQV